MNARIEALGDRPRVAFTFGGRAVEARQGDTVAMALWAAGHRVLRASSSDGAPRGVFCNMGVCFECQMSIDGVLQRACTTLVRAGMRVEAGGRP